MLVLDLYLGRDDEVVLEHIPALVQWAGVVVLHTAEEKPVPLRRALALGVHGVVLKNDGTEALISVVRRALRGRLRLQQRPGRGAHQRRGHRRRG